MRSKLALPLALLLVAAPLAALAMQPAQAAGATMRLSAFGDDGANDNTRATVAGAVRDGAQAHLGLGDYYYWDPPSAWRAILQPLLDKGANLALGNHDDASVLADLFPSGTMWSKSFNGARVVAIDSTRDMWKGSAQYNTVRGMLCSASEDVRILVSHHNWWLQSGARHPGSEFRASASDMDALVRDCGVDLVLAGHEHNYQRAMRDGVPYLIVGTGGASLYAVAGSAPGTVASYSGYGYVLLDVSPTGFSAQFKSNDGRVRDSFAYAASGATPAPAPSAPATGAPQVTFTSQNGNEWWVQTRLGGADAGNVVKVEARDANTPFSTIPLRSWGAWAGSIHVEPGNTVTYRATLADGRQAESCAFAHPAGTCASAPTPTPTPSQPAGGASVTFAPSNGNEWWVQTKLGGADAARVAKVEARDENTAWTTLAWRSWGAYAASFRVEPGNTVTYRATLTDGATVTSCAYTHPTAPTCASDASPATGSWSASFANARGNEWWVETNVNAQGLASVDARVDAGAWTPLSKKSWGSWATSMRAPTGSVVEFRATSTTGATTTSAGVAWPP